MWGESCPNASRGSAFRIAENGVPLPWCRCAGEEELGVVGTGATNLRGILKGRRSLFDVAGRFPAERLLETKLIASIAAGSAWLLT